MKNLKTITAITALMIGFGTAGIAKANINKNIYELKGAAPTGSKIPSVDAKSALPFDKRYFELSEAEKQLFRSRYDNLAPAAIPPFPSAGLKAIYKPIINQAKRGGAQGRLTIKVMVDEYGQVSDLTVMESPNQRLSKATKKILLKTRFDPALCDGQPCEMVFPVSIKFG